MFPITTTTLDVINSDSDDDKTFEELFGDGEPCFDFSLDRNRGDDTRARKPRPPLYAVDAVSMSAVELQNRLSDTLVTSYVFLDFVIGHLSDM